MKRFLTLLGIPLLCVQVVCAQMQIDLKEGTLRKGLEKQTVPTRGIREVENGYEVTYKFHTATILDDMLFPNTVFWKMDGFGLNDIPGEPEYLFRNDMLAVPGNSICKVEVVDSSYVDFHYELTPARQPLMNNDSVGYTRETVMPIKEYKGFRPSSVAVASGMQKYRGRGIFSTTLFPIQYNHEERTVRAYTSITYRVTIEGEEENEATLPYMSPDDHFLSNITLNGGGRANIPPIAPPPPPAPGAAQYDVKSYLIISTPMFEEAVNRFAEWKRLMGFNMHIALQYSWTPQAVKDSICCHYDADSSLKYVLFIGDHSDVPAQCIHEQTIVGASDILPEHYTDFYYTCMDGPGDEIPDVLHGRISVSTLMEANIVVDKIIQYEQTPPIEPNFYQNAAHCSYFEDAWYPSGYEDNRFVQTSEDIRTYVMGKGKNIQRIYYAQSHVIPTNWSIAPYSYGDPIPNELRKPEFAWNGCDTDISNAINSGVFYMLHRDHGMIRYWQDPYYSTEQILGLFNRNLLPVVFSINCHTGQFTDDCFAESFLKKGDGGCVAIYAASQTSFSGHNDELVVGMFDAIWPNPGLRITFPNNNVTGSTAPFATYELGQILNQGLMRMEETCEHLDNLRLVNERTYTKEVFHCFGDPSMKIYTDQPTEFEDVSIDYNTGCVSVRLSPSDTARITIYDTIADSIASYIGNNVTFATNNPYDVTVCISAHNKIPYIQEGSIYIQNETVSGTHQYQAGRIKVGKNVTSTKPTGNVLFQNGNIQMKAKEVTLDKGTTIKRGSTLEINNH